MARLTFPSDRLVYTASAYAGSAFTSAANATATVYSDSAGTTLADVQNFDGSPNATATFTVDTTSRLPLFLGPAAGTDTLYVKVGTGPVTAIYAVTSGDISAAVGVEVTNRTAADAAHVAAANPHSVTPQMIGAPTIVIHGATAGTARPAGATFVHWVGSVAPTNVTGNDEWTDTANKIVKRWNGSSFDSLGSAASSPAWRFDVVTYGAVVDNVTDDTAAIQAAINAAYAWADTNALGYAEIYSSIAGVSAVSGALVTTGGYNAQIKLPDRAISKPKITLRFIGAAQSGPHPDLFVGGQTVKQTIGWVLRSTLTGKSYDSTFGLPCVIGGPDFEKTVVPRSYVFSNLRVEGDLHVRLPDNPSVAAVNLRGVAQTDMNEVYVDTDVVQGSDHGGGTHNITTPSHYTGVGVAFPGVNCNGWSKANKVTTVGVACSVIGSEHTDIGHHEALSCLAVLGVVEGFDHELTVRRGNAEWNPNLVTGWSFTTGLVSLAAFTDGLPMLLRYDIEDANATNPGAGDWRIAASHILDANNTFVGKFINTVTLAGGGRRNALIKTGGAGLIDCPTTPTRWVDATLSGTWVDFDQATYGKAGYRKDPDGMVELRGLVKLGTAPGNGNTNYILQLPAGFRPSVQKIFPTVTSGTAAGALEVSGANVASADRGKVWTDATTNALIGLDGIRFLAEA